MLHVQLSCPMCYALHTVSHTLSSEGVAQQHAVSIVTDICAASSGTFSTCTSSVHEAVCDEHQPVIMTCFMWLYQYMQKRDNGSLEMLQGTPLPKEVAEQLDDMFEHTALESAAHSIKKQYEQLQTWQRRLQSSKQWAGDADQQTHGILHRQVHCLA